MPLENSVNGIRLFSGFARGSLRLITRGNRVYALWLAFLGALIVSGALAYANQVRFGLFREGWTLRLPPGLPKKTRSSSWGFKSAHYQSAGWPSIDNAIKAGNLTGLPVMVDFRQITKERGIDILFQDKLRPGDIYTHCFSGHREEVLENGDLNPAMVEGRRRKIIFDIGFGQASFYWYVAVPCLQSGLLSGLHFHGPAHEQHEWRNEEYNEQRDVGHSGTWHSAGGSIPDGAWAQTRRSGSRNWGIWMWAPKRTHIAVLRVEHGHFGLLDSAGARMPGTQRISRMTLGLERSPGMTSIQMRGGLTGLLGMVFVELPGAVGVLGFGGPAGSRRVLPVSRDAVVQLRVVPRHFRRTMPPERQSPRPSGLW